MSTRWKFLPRALALALAFVPGVSHAAVTAAPGWHVHAMPTPTTVQGGVVRAGQAVFVGQGPTYTAGAQSVIRLVGGVPTVVATGFNSLGGFALGANGTLYVVDNGLEAPPGASTGDTVYAIPDALTRTTPVTALGAEVLPAGSIPFAADVAVDGTDLLVSDGAGPGAGRVVRVTGGTATNLITGLDYAAGLTVTGTELLVGNVDGTFVGSLREYTTAGTFVTTRAAALTGIYAQEYDNAGNVLVTGGFADDFTGSVVVVAPGGGISERARGFAFSAELFHDAVRNETLVLDFGATAITAICRDSNTNAACDADELCVGGVALGKPKLTLKKLGTPPGDDVLSFKGEMVIPTAPAIDPVARGARVAVSDTGGTVLDVTIPAGLRDPVTKIGWKPNKGGTAWTYTNPTGLAGIRRVAIRTNPAKFPGRVQFTVSGKKGAYPTTPANLPLAATFTVWPTGQCGTVTFTGPSSPVCTFNGTNSTVTCK